MLFNFELRTYNALAYSVDAIISARAAITR
jgi:hypothetical protein